LRLHRWRIISLESKRVTHPYSIFIWNAPSGWQSEGYWQEPVQVAYEQYALYLAGLIHKDSKAAIKVVRYGLTIACFPDEQTVKRVEQQIAREWPHRQLFTRPR
jgi:hypothetical protein